jgi:hypothetical protein
MLKFIKSFFKKPEPVAAESAPYKMPEPAPVTTIPLVVEPAPVVEQATQVIVESVAEVKPAKAKKAPAKPKAEKAPKVAAMTATKKPRAPRKPKAN